MFLFRNAMANPGSSIASLFRRRIGSVVLLIPCADQLAVRLSVFSILYQLALTAATAAARMNKQVVTEEWMAANAMRLAGVLGRWIVAAKHIHLMRDRLQMIGIHARGIAAEMIEFKAIRDRADPHFVGESVCFDRAAVVTVENAMAVFVPSTHPVPTTGRLHLDLGQEAIHRMNSHTTLYHEEGPCKRWY